MIVQLASSLVAPYPVTILVTSRETGSVNVSKVTEACIVVVVRAFEIKAFHLLAIAFSSLEPILVALVHGRFAVAKNVVTVVATIGRPGVIAPTVVTIRVSPASISKTKWTIDATRVRTNNHSSYGLAPELCSKKRTQLLRASKSRE